MKRDLSQWLSLLVSILAMVYVVITLMYFVSNPVAWLGRSWRFSILFLSYAPLIHDVFFYGLFTLILYLKFERKTWIALFLTWSFAEASGNILGTLAHYSINTSIDPTYPYKTIIFISLFAVSLVIANRMKFLNEFMLVASCFVLPIYFMLNFFWGYIPYYPLTNGLETVLYLGIMYWILTQKPETRYVEKELPVAGLSGLTNDGSFESEITDRIYHIGHTGKSCLDPFCQFMYEMMRREKAEGKEPIIYGHM